MFFRTPFVLPLLYPGLTWRIPTQEKDLYLTFDDGPMPGPTEFVLDELRKRNARATFFCIGENAGRHPELFQRIQEQGHRIGNHTFNHLKGWNTSVKDYVDNVSRCNEEFSRRGLTLVSRGLFRPPYGRIRQGQINALSDYQIVMWDVLTYDYSHSMSEERCLRGSLDAVRPGSIVVFHDSLKAEKNMRYALPRFLDHFANLGYSFKAISNS